MSFWMSYVPSLGLAYLWPTHWLQVLVSCILSAETLTVRRCEQAEAGLT